MASEGPSANGARTGLQQARSAIKELSPWSKGLLLASIGMIALGGALLAIEGDDSGAPTSHASQDAGPPSSALQGHNLVDTTPPISGTPTREQIAPSDSGWSPLFLKGGFSFFAAFCVGLALRIFVRLVLMFCGFFLVLLFLLSQGGLVTVEWQTMSDMFDNLGSNLAGQFNTFKEFMTGSLPAAGMATLGLVVGLRRK